MLRKWTHGHSIGTGAFAGLAAASYRVWLLLAVAFLAGFLLDRLLLNWRKVVRRADSLTRAKRLEILSRAWGRRRTKHEQEEAEKKAYWRGARDAL